jgi:hypothetical protein
MKNDLRSRRQPAQREPLRITPAMVMAALALMVVLYFVGLWVYNAYFVSDETKIRGLVFSAARAAQDRRPSGITATLSEGFVCQTPLRTLDRDECHQAFVYLLMNMYRRVEVRLAPDPIPVVVESDRKTAEVTFQARVTGWVTEDSPPEDIQKQSGGERYILTAKLTENGWKFTNLRIEKEP